jgi:hypothetical protein
MRVLRAIRGNSLIQELKESSVKDLQENLGEISPEHLLEKVKGALNSLSLGEFYTLNFLTSKEATEPRRWCPLDMWLFFERKDAHIKLLLENQLIPLSPERGYRFRQLVCSASGNGIGREIWEPHFLKSLGSWVVPSFLVPFKRNKLDSIESQVLWLKSMFLSEVLSPSSKDCFYKERDYKQITHSLNEWVVKNEQVIERLFDPFKRYDIDHTRFNAFSGSSALPYSIETYSVFLDAGVIELEALNVFFKELGELSPTLKDRWCSEKTKAWLERENLLKLSECTSKRIKKGAL